MGVDLYAGPGRSFSTSWFGWTWLLSLAEAHGWRRQGTRADPTMIRLQLAGRDAPAAGAEPELDAAVERAAADWRGGYASNDWQVVTAEEAAAMADALARAVGRPAAEPDSPDLPVLPDLPPADRAAVEEFIEFLRGGQFRIA